MRDMRKEAGLTAIFIVVTGSIGLFFRWLQMLNLYEPGTDLPVPGMFSSKMIVGLCALTVLVMVLLVLLRYRQFSSDSDFRIALRSRTVLYPLISLVSAVLMILGGVMSLLNREFGDTSLLRTLTLVLAVVSGAGFPVLAMGPKKGSDGKLLCMFSIVPVAYFCLRILADYRINASNPVQWSYAPEILAMSMAALGFYYMAGYAFEEPRPKQALFFGYVSAFLMLLIIGGNLTAADRLICAGTAMMLLSQSFVLGSNLRPTSEIEGIYADAGLDGEGTGLEDVVGNFAEGTDDNDEDDAIQ